MGSSDDDEERGRKPVRQKTMSRWKPEEDALLQQLVSAQVRSIGSEDQPVNWTKIAASMGSRSSKQCRERYVNHIK